jgi:Fur family ferric uptake transcriptional regulator
VRRKYPGIGYTTVYRTMKLLCEAGLASERHFDDGVTRFEIEHEHHDHLVCLRCGKIVEFECSMIESAQDRIVNEYGFRLLRHRHELYGHCPSCRDDR